MIIASYNVENLFERASALKPGKDSKQSSATHEAHAEITRSSAWSTTTTRSSDGSSNFWQCLA